MKKKINYKIVNCPKCQSKEGAKYFDLKFIKCFNCGKITYDSKTYK
jgi:transcription initiation factor TFIIIB Brf1 subunit/transcription initiation factor TFIIB